MPFTSNTAPLKHYPETNKEDAHKGYVVIPEPPVDKSNNNAQLEGKKIPVKGNYPRLTD